MHAARIEGLEKGGDRCRQDWALGRGAVQVGDFAEDIERHLADIRLGTGQNW